MGCSGYPSFFLLAVVLLRLAFSRRLLNANSDLEHRHEISLADFGAALPEGANVSEAELDAIVEKLVEARRDNHANRCTISMEPLLVDDKVGPDGLVVVVEPPGEGARPGAQVRVNMYTVPAAKGWYCVRNPRDPITNLPLRTTTGVLVLSDIPGPLCDYDGTFRQTELRRHVAACDVIGILSELRIMTNESIRELDTRGRTVLFMAVENYCVLGVEMLLSRMNTSTVGVQDAGGETVLHAAAADGVHELVALLLPHMDAAAVNARASVYGGKTALAKAAMMGFSVTARTLLAVIEARELGSQDYSGRTALHYAADPFPSVSAVTRRSASMSDEVIDKPAIIRMLLEKMDDNAVLLQDQLGWNALHIAADAGAVRAVEALLSGMSASALRAPDREGLTVLHHAVGHTGVQSLVLEAIPDDDFLVARTGNGSTALHVAMPRRLCSRSFSNADALREGCAVHIVSELVERMARSAATAQHIAAPDRDGMTILHWACARTPAEYAKSDAFDAKVHLVLQHMNTTAVDAADNSGCTALHYAAKQGLAGVARLLLTRMGSAAISAKDGRNMTALHYAASIGDVWLVKSIAWRMDRAALDAKDAEGRTARQIAGEMGCTLCASMLMVHRAIAG